MHFPRLALCASLIACTGDTEPTEPTDTDEPTDTGTDTDTGTPPDTSHTLTVNVDGALPTNRLAVLRGTFGTSFTQQEVVADVAAAASQEITLPEPDGTSVYLAVLYDDADDDGTYDGDLLHGAATTTRSWNATDGWDAEDWSDDANPVGVELDTPMEVSSLHGLVPTLEATVDVSKLSQPDRLTTVSAFQKVRDDLAGAMFDVPIKGGVASGTPPAVPDASRFASPDGLAVVLETIIAIEDIDASGSYTGGDALAAWMCSGSNPVNLVYVSPNTDPGIAFFHAIYNVPNGWRASDGFGPQGEVLELDDAELKSLVISDTACGF